METFTIVALSICAIVLVWAIWMTICNEITYKQRIKILNYVNYVRLYYGNLEKSSKMFDELNRISYDDHLYAVAKLRNPMKLYNQELFGDMK